MMVENPKAYSLRSHQTSTVDTYGELMVNSQQSDLKVGDVVQVYKEDNDKTIVSILLKVSYVGEVSDVIRKGDSISILDTICSNSNFNFKLYEQVYMRKVEPTAVDLVVLTCKDTYLSRSDMWRLKQLLDGTCVYLEKRISYLGLNKMQVSVSEVWAEGETLTCGYISSNTRICFRSSTAAVHLFLQMSAEMWQYDSYGDLYFEKAVSGFLNELFNFWKEAECCHDVTIVMFSRTFYEAKCIDDFPNDMKECIQKDIHGKFYEDFYRVVIQNERYGFDDWKNTIMKLKKLFINYEKKVLREEERIKNPSIPKAFNSSAAQGNLLEVLNMSLNVYEKYYLDRNFDRLGKTTMVITPGPGVFEVDKELMSVTKHRTIDSGCAADLICMGEQPLHAVPLFKVYRSKNDKYTDSVYRIPKSWLNHSFYTSQSQMRSTSTSQFIPRIKQASKKTEQELMDESAQRISVFADISEVDESGDDTDYDSYDKTVFSVSHRNRGRSVTLYNSRRQRDRQRNTSDEVTDIAPSLEQKKPITFSITGNTAAGAAANAGNTGPGISSGKYMDTSLDRDHRLPYNRDSDDSSDEDQQIMAGSADKLDKFDHLPTSSKHKKNVDPFAPHYIKQPTSANRRRWVHAFPIDKHGYEIQPHHYIDDQRAPISSHRLVVLGSSRMRLAKRVSSDLRPQRFLSATSFDGMVRSASPDSIDDSYIYSPQSYRYSSHGESAFAHLDHGSYCNLYGKEDLAEFSPMVKTGVDWRSLTTPALLPITTDYFPSEQHLKNYYSDSVYTVVASDESANACANFLKELVSTRLALGFQLIVAKEDPSKDHEPVTPTPVSGLAKRQRLPLANTEMYKLSIGKIFHQISFLDDTITVKVQKPKKGSKLHKIPYKYQFLNPDDKEYTVSFTQFTTEQLEEYRWNVLDNYVTRQSASEYRDIVQAGRMKYWRSRFCLLPANPNVKAICERIRSSKQPLDCDQFHQISKDEYPKYNENFVKFMDLLNSVRRSRQRSGGKKETRSLSSDDSKLGRSITPPVLAGDRSIDITKIDGRKVIEMMKDAQTGMSFLDLRVAGTLPYDTFISFEAIHWLKNNIPYIHNTTDAFSVLQKLLSDGLIRHIPVEDSEGDTQLECGYYLYYIVSSQSHTPTPPQESSDDSYTFEREWIEVSLPTGLLDATYTPLSPRGGRLQRQVSSPPTSMSLTLGSQASAFTAHRAASPKPLERISKQEYKSADLDSHSTDSKIRAELKRIEWTSIKYHSCYHPACAFDFELDWIVATAGLLYEMINSWRRKVNSFGYHILPIPVDPFALPTEENSDPLRGPLFVAIAVDCLENLPSSELTEFMVYIIKRYGFINISHDITGNRKLTHTQFIHCSGGFFLLVQEPSADKKPGFHWSWNFMMTKQWWTSSSGEESFQDSMLADFRDLTSNQNGRLVKMRDDWMKSK